MKLLLSELKRRQNRVSQRGAILVEAAICSMLLLLLTSGSLEYGSLFASTIDSASAVRSGARAGAATNINGPPSDFDVLQAIHAEVGNRSSEIQKIVIYKATVGQAGPSSACRTSASSIPSQSCDVYGNADFNSTKSTIDASSAAKGWPAASRSPGQDYVGVWIQAKHFRLFGFVPAPDHYSDYVTVLLEGSSSSLAAKPWSSGTTKQTWTDTPSWFCFQGQCIPDCRVAGACDSDPGGPGAGSGSV